MSQSKTYTLDCDVCGGDLEVEVTCTYRGHGPRWITPGEPPEFDWTLPTQCGSCGQVFSTDHQAALNTQIDEKLANENENWWERYPEPDSDTEGDE